MKILKTSEIHNTVTFVILEPDEVDRNGDKISKNEVIKTAHEFMLNLDKKSVNVNHEKNTDTPGAKFVESYIVPFDFEKGGEIIKKGSWCLGIKFNEKLYKQVLNGEIVGVSMEGTGYSKN